MVEGGGEIVEGNAFGEWWCRNHRNSVDTNDDFAFPTVSLMLPWLVPCSGCLDGGISSMV